MHTVDLKTLKVALVHDWLIEWGGAEQVLLAMHRCFPTAPVYTALYDPKALPAEFNALDIRTTFLQNIPGAIKHHRHVLPLMPLAFEQLDLRDYDVVISSSHACAKGVITGPNTLHISYVHTPLRYAWDMYHDYMAHDKPNPIKHAIMHSLLHYLRLWDTHNTQRVDHLLCNSQFVQRRIQKYYRREAHVVYPPVTLPDPKTLTQTPRQDYYLVAGRLVSYKRVDLVIEAFRQSGKPLKIAGDGPQRDHWIQNLPPNIEYLGNVTRSQLEALYRKARGLVFAPLEDFGMVPVEAQGFGCPVIAFGKGGALDSVKPEITGVFFTEQTPESLNTAIAHFESLALNEAAIIEHAQQFSVENFERALCAYVKHQWLHFKD